MIFVQTLIKTLDNSGARIVQCIKVLNKSCKKGAIIGSLIIVSIKEIIPRIIYNKKKHLKKKKTIQKGEVHHGIIVCCNSKLKRYAWQIWKSRLNKIVILNKQFNPIGSRVLGPIFYEIKKKNFLKLVSLATYLI